MNRNKIAVYRGISILLMFVLTICSVVAQAYVINDYKVHIDINKEGYFDVSETIDVFFNEERRGIIRNIPKNVKVNDKTQAIQLSNVDVQDYKYKLLSEGNDKLIRIGEADKYITGPVRYRISFRLGNAFIFTESHVEFLYNIISDWDCPIQNVGYVVSVPEEFELAFNDYKVITGKTGEDKREASLVKDGLKFSGSSMKPLQPGENITLAIKFPKGYITPPPPPPSIFELDKFWAIPVALFFYLLSFFYRSRKEYIPEVAGVHYFPPENLSPAEVGAYHDHKVNTEDLIALLPYWANQGYIKIMTNGLSGKGKELFFKKLEDLPAGRPRHEQIVFEEMFRTDDMVILSDFKNSFYKVLFKASSEIQKSLLDKGLYDEEHYRTFHSGKFAFGGLILIIAGITMTIGFKLFLSGPATIILGVTAAVIHFLRPRRSDKGVRIKAQLESLKKFLKSDDGSESYKLIKENEKYFEQVYPYAIALGVDKSWLKTLESGSFESYAPYWFSYHDQPAMQRTVPLSEFNASFSVPEIKSVFTSYPASQAGSSGGGGFSGGSAGGGIGGGGSSW